MKQVDIFIFISCTVATKIQVHAAVPESCNFTTSNKNDHEVYSSFILVSEFNKKISTHELINTFNIPLTVLRGMLLHTAVCERKPNLIQDLISLQADLNIGNRNGITPLYRAIEGNQTEIMDILMACGADPNFSMSTITLLHVAVLSGNKSIVQQLIRLGAIMDSKDKGGKTPLYYAAEFNRTAIIELLLKAGADVNIKTGEGKSLLHIAVVENRPHLVQKLVQLGINVNIMDSNGYTPFYLSMVANNSAIESFLMKNGVNINTVSQNRTSMLHKAVSEGHIYVVDKLMKFNCNISNPDINEIHPIHLAIINNNLHMLRHLIKNYINVNEISQGMNNYPINFAVDCGSILTVKTLLDLGALRTVKNMQGLTPLVQTIFQNKPDITNLLLSNINTTFLEINYNVDDNWNKPLHIAVSKGDEASVVKLLDFGANSNQPNKIGKTPLCIAVEKDNVAMMHLLEKRNADLRYQVSGTGETLLHMAVKKKAINAARELLKGDINVNTADNLGLMPLTTAVILNDTKIIRLLVRHGANTNVKLSNGDYPLLVAISNSSLLTVMTLINLGAESEPKTGTTSIERAISTNRAAALKLLVSKGANLFPKRKSYLHIAAQLESVEVILTLLQLGVPVDQKHHGKTPLWTATSRNNINAMRILLENGADINVTTFHPFSIQGEGSDSPTWSLIHEAAFLDLENATRLLLDHGISINSRDYRGWTPLHYAVVSNKLRLAQLLIEKGADIHAITRNGISPLDLVSYSTEERKIFMTKALQNFLNKHKSIKNSK